jgi:hypothetical protein
MKGILLRVIEDVVSEVFSADAWDDVIDRSGVSGVFTSLGNYPDGDLVEIVRATATVTSLSEDDTLRLLGRTGFEHFRRRYPDVIKGFDGWKATLASLDDIIHPEVLKSSPDAKLPSFVVVSDGAALIVTYISERAVCSLAEGLILGCGDWFDVELSVKHLTCIQKGGESCTLRVAEAG